MEDLTDKIELSVAIAKKNKGIISLLGISNEDDILKIREAYQRIKKNLAIRSQEYDSQFLLTHDKATQISKFSQDDNADIIILNYKDEDSWKSFFLENFFKQIINYTDIPLLFLKNRQVVSNINSDDSTALISLFHVRDKIKFMITIQKYSDKNRTNANQKQEIVQFLFTHLEQYGDPEKIFLMP